MIYKNKNRLFKIIFAKRNDVSKILYLQNIVYNNLENKDSFMKAKRNDFLKTMHNGFIFLVFVKKQLVAYSCCEYTLPENYPLFLKKEKIVRFKNTVVKEKYRGYGLQNKLISLRINKTAKKYKFAILNVHPDNVISKKNILDNNFVYLKTGKMGNYLREFYMLKLS
jgi:predicted GNAT family acetyltransferase